MLDGDLIKLVNERKRMAELWLQGGDPVATGPPAAGASSVQKSEAKRDEETKGGDEVVDKSETRTAAKLAQPGEGEAQKVFKDFIQSLNLLPVESPDTFLIHERLCTKISDMHAATSELEVQTIGALLTR